MALTADERSEALLTIRRGLDEDLRYGPDVTTVATVPADARTEAALVAREPGVAAGVAVALMVLDEVLGADGYRVLDRVQDGARLEPGQALLRVEADTRGLLTAERTLLNLLCHLSGIATATAAWVAAVEGTKTKIRDTRKTLPGLRALQKYAVRVGGGVNHRMGLGDAALIKDNHVAAAGSVVAALRAVRAAAPDLPCEVEVDTLEQLDEVLGEDVELILLDNFPVWQTQIAVQRRDARAPQVLLETLGQVGGTKALAAVAAAAKNGDDAQKDVASRLLGEWMTADAAPVLLDLSKSLAEDKYRGRAIRGFIRIARQFKLEQAERSKMAVEAYAATKTPAERKLVLEVARRYPDIEMLKLAAKAGAEEEIKPEARIAAAAIVKKLPEESAEAYALAKGLGLEKVKLEIVKATFGAGDRQKDVTDVVRKNAGSLALIFIPGDNFNKVFGGDPAPGAEKHLTIDYTIDGKAGTAKIGENGTILLPTP